MSIRWENKLDFSGLMAAIEAAIPVGLQDAGEHIGEVSAQQVPILEGTLLRSQRIEVDEANHRVAISYHTPYANKQHEDPELKHTHGNAKYLELPLISEGGTGLGLVAKRIGDAL